MASTIRSARLSRWRTPLLALGVAVAMVGRVEAQFGIGFGFGLGPQTPASVDYLNQRSLISAQNAATNRQNRTFDMGGFANNPNSYFNRRREAALQERFSVSNQRGLDSRISPGLATLDLRPRNARANPITGEFQRPDGAPAPAEPVQVASAAPLDAFFNAYRELVWPSDAPYHEDFKPLRETSDTRTLSTLKETETQGRATVATATQARESLLDYGRPALQYIREHSTTQVADNFHSFLLALYNSIQQSALVARPVAENK